MKFSHLRLSGFKSFVEPTELLIKDGLTGIVGPNGCGKSNLVEALTWVMGETSARNLRGGAMDDVIFAGTTSRPPRNAAEVTLGLDNRERTAPASYNDSSELDVSRRIRRETGSDYRINGKVARARDVQLLFADLATGAHSTAIVSQGRVGALINAKPKERRHLLEEAAGISGLHSRRHEAELRLNSAETNLERVDDVIEQLEVQLGNLKRQARQANRYRNISGHIRKTEALLLFRKHQQAQAKAAEAREKYEQAVMAVNELTRQAATAESATLRANEALKPLRDAEAAAASAVHRLTVARESLDAEEERAKRTKQQLEDRKSQISHDMVREKDLEKDSAEAIARLEEEKSVLKRETETAGPRAEALLAKVNEKATSLQELQSAFDTKTETVAAQLAERNSLIQQIETATAQLGKIKARLEDLDREKATLQEKIEADGGATSSASLQENIISLNDLNTACDEAEILRQAADGAEREAREKVKLAERDVTTLETEERTLSRLLESSSDGEWPGIIEELTVSKGYEMALGAALGDELEAPADDAASAYWQTLEGSANSQNFKGGAETLDQFVKGHPALKARLSQIAVIDAKDGPAMQSDLKPGQRLVTRNGDLWRWDGFTRKAGAKTAAAARLEQRNRLEEIAKDLAKKRDTLANVTNDLKGCSDLLGNATEKVKNLRRQLREQEQELSKLRAANAEEIRQNAARQSRLTSLQENIFELSSEQEALVESLAAKQQLLDRLPDMEGSRAEIETVRASLHEKRDELAVMRSESDRVEREAATRRDRLAAIDREVIGWIERNKNMAAHFVQLEMRFKDTSEELAEIESKPEEIATKRNNLMDEVARAEGQRNGARDKLAEAESILSECDAALKKCQDALATCREERVRHQSDVEHMTEVLKGLAEQVREKLECSPDQIKAAGGIEENEEIPPVDDSERKLDRLKRERDNMGPVNLRAEIEAAEVEEQLTTLTNEREDLLAAIARLRQGISGLNREGRERLLAAFTKVDEHFQHLFKQVFGGGQAHLTLTESDDPLAAGLEIMASPPGKKLQLMSLLSGGEQALTAVALLFAVFLTNPAPICVLDEVDAPLDDVNVERLCHLLDSIAQNSETRFLVVTHHPITMARMDRLFGVTMAERGISQLVSVDLEQAKEITENAA
ncbi:chromosome segregation protein SMC [Sneathiella sp. HT1-7]|uniref:chromosome segregation protein SMC n=1 Tax=Sneathiella sp. HT1-7 TaxID=2887192 RepID=UPI001D14641A|nr:chromosome segregation protein SMC [Sneathiella sp. HT1-7]MCC3303396.1 chromosome segregation protein SMC [Sneathiella sp. HT1-7]